MAKMGFTEWLSHISSVHQANKPAVERALQRLADADQFGPNNSTSKQ